MFIQKEPSRGLFKKVLWEISQNSQENICTRISFLIKSNSVDLQLIKSESLAQSFCCEFCEVCKKSFLQNTNGRLLLIIAVSLVLKGKLVKKIVNYNMKTKAYVPIRARSVVIRKGQSWWNLNRLQKESFADFRQNRCS